MATKKYIVKLTPHDKFFFGGEKNFGQKDNKDDDTSITNYFVKSNYFPQQTGVLGFVRHQLLLQCNDEKIFKDNKIQKPTLAGDLIGFASFNKDEDFKFGAIKSISPIFISNAKNEYFFPANKEYQCNKDDKKFQFLEINLDNMPLLEDYKPKIGLADLFINSNNDKIAIDAIFKEVQQVGIRKKYEGGTDDNAYYMQTFLKFKADFSFAFIVELEENTIFTSQNITVFGAEQQTFKMEVADFKSEFKELIPAYQKSRNTDKIVLISDAYVENDLSSVCKFAITDTIHFRFLETNTEKGGNYYKKPNKSKRFTLYKKGSVFYGNTEAIKEKLEIENFRNLGYNQYIKIDKK